MVIIKDKGISTELDSGVAKALQNLQSHWALSAIPEADRIRAAEVVNERLVRQTVGHQITFAFAEDEADEGLLERVALAYEIAAIEGLDVLSRPDGGDNGLREQAVAEGIMEWRGNTHPL